VKSFGNGIWSQSGQVTFPPIHVMQSVLCDIDGSSSLRTSTVLSDLSLNVTLDTTVKLNHAHTAIDIA
jgi:hypothetical protein